MHILVKHCERHLSVEAASFDDLERQIAQLALNEDFSMRSVAGRPIRELEPFVEVCYSLKGGKGGFGSMLRQQGGRMSSKKTTNFMACRDLEGRRVKAIREAQQLAKHMENKDQILKEKEEKIMKKIEEGLKLGEDDGNKKKELFDDTKFVESHEKAVDGVEKAVAQAMLKKIKKKSNK
jgi:hypothetical protein